MKTDPYPPIIPQNFVRMASEWADVIQAQESGTWIWPPLNAPYRRIWQFQNDTELQKKLLGDSWDKHLFVHVDFEQRQSIPKETCYGTIVQAIHTQSLISFPPSNELLSTIDDLIKKHGMKLNLFVTGVDTAIRSNQWDVIEELGYLGQRNWETHIILFVETDITDPLYFIHFSRRTTLAQNVTITPMYTPEDTKEFLKYIAYNWNVRLHKDQMQWIMEQCGGHFLLAKDAVRILRKTSDLTPDEMANAPSLHMRAQAIVDNLMGNQRDVLNAVVHKKNIPDSLKHARDFLVQQGWIRTAGNKNFTLTVPFLKGAILLRARETTREDIDFHLLLTKLEKQVFDFMEQNANTIVTREMIGKTVWGESWEEKYSDWAIDKLMYRIRTKLESSNVGRKIITRKGRGFVLI